jgi:cell division protein FtsA
MAKNGYIVGIDIGTRTVTVLIGEINEERKIEVIGIGTAESRGLRKGVVVNLDETSEAIKKARTDAELMAGQEIHAAFIGVSGAHIKSFNSRGVIAVSGRNREITQEDIRRVLEQSKAVPIPPDREIIHVIPQEFIVDEQDGIHDPLGMNGIKLEVNVHIVTGAVTLLQNLRTCIERSDIVIQSLVLNQIADAAAVLSPDEKELGVGLIDIGAGTTEVAVFERGSLWYTSIIPLGGDNFTNDIAVGLRAAIPDAEKIKKNSAAPFRPRARSRRRSRSRSSARTASPGFSPASSWPRSSSRGPRRSSAWWTTTSSAWDSKNRSTPASS